METLPIFERLVLTLLHQEHQDQITLPLPHHLTKLALHSSNTITASLIHRHQRINGSANKRDDDDDDGIWSAMFFSLYTTPIGIGNPPLKMSATVDTSWSTSFVPSVNCTYNAGEIVYCMIHPLYNSSLSSTFQSNSTPVKVLYDGPAGLSTWGYLSQDSLHLGDMEIKRQIFEEVTEWHPDIGTRDDLFDTALGLSLFQTSSGRSKREFAGTSPFQNMMYQKLLDRNIVSITYSRSDQELGELMLGGMPAHLRREEMIEVPLDHTKMDDSDEVWRHYTHTGWQIPLKDMSMTPNNSNTTIPVLDIPQTAVISSSFPWIGLPDEAAEKIHEAIGLKMVFDWIDCDKRSELPNWTLQFGSDGQTITLTPWDYLIEVYDKLYEVLKCVSPFYNLSEFGDKGFIILGAAFMNGLHTVFDADRKSISFAKRPM